MKKKLTNHKYIQFYRFCCYSHDCSRATEIDRKEIAKTANQLNAKRHVVGGMRHFSFTKNL